MTERILCLGEALIDVVQRADAAPVEHVGGSILNVARGLARLGHRTSLGSWWANDARGRHIAEAVTLSGAEIEPGSDQAVRTTVAQATLDEEGRARYSFDVEWAVPPLRDLEQVAHIHTGSFSALLEPGGSSVVQTVRAVRGHATASYDPNIRPSLIGEPADVLPRVEELVALSDVVKASDEDVQWLRPDADLEHVMREWLALGPELVVVTRGPSGADALLRADGQLRHVEPAPVTLADTVGAGDSFMAGLVSGLLETGFLGGVSARERLATASWDAVAVALRKASFSAAITVSTHGAYGPTALEIAAQGTQTKASAKQ